MLVPLLTLLLQASPVAHAKDPPPSVGYRRATVTAYVGVALGGVGVTTFSAGLPTGSPYLVIPGRVLATVGAPMMAGGSLRAAKMGQRMTRKPFSTTGGSVAWGLWAGSLVLNTVGNLVPHPAIAISSNLLLAGSYSAAGAQLAHNNARIASHMGWEAMEADVDRRRPIRLAAAPQLRPGGGGLLVAGLF